jgi:hypothetical protein
VVWFLVGIVVSTLLIVVIPPLDLALLFVLFVAGIVQWVYYRVRDPSLAAILFGVLAVSLYTLVWALTTGQSGDPTSMGKRRRTSHW